ncbi:hypothetical protein O6H91_01G049000 [Diphasiastrum complanatum]|uniref:Uncharacterized protein n=2 Tax=Diphasiastrum complanatum TaxID=34168 RepID=A0ACC2EQN1_DIPCM|nr:hypothetical protein O6H91_01G049000 [Diphasiastrum complanatum]
MDGGGQEDEGKVGCRVLMRRPPLLLGYWMLSYLKSMTITCLSGRLSSLRVSSSYHGSVIPNPLHPGVGRPRRWNAAFFLEQMRRQHLLTTPVKKRILKPSSDKKPEHHSKDRASCSTSFDAVCFGERDSGGSPIDILSACVQSADGNSSSDETSSLDWSNFSREMYHTRPSPVTSSSNGSKSTFMWEEKREKRETDLSEVDMMKERFARLLLGEDMSGGGKGVCTALAISNAITNLAASVFGELWRLEPLSLERRTMWRREMEWLLSVCDHILEFVPSSQIFPDGSNLEVMVSRPRSDLHINLPALRKLDTMLLESLDSYKETEFWYVEQDISISDRELQDAPHQTQLRQNWWLPTPKVPVNGLSDEARNRLQYQRECTNQILKAAMSINGQTLSEMEVPDVYWEALPKNVKSCLGEVLYRGLSSEQFSADGLLAQLDLSTLYNTLEVANRLESAILVWHRKVEKKNLGYPRDSKSTAKLSWGKMKDFVGDADKGILLVENAESVLLSLRQRFPGLPQTVLDMNKIQYNQDVGQAILESYSRVLESLAFNIISRIEEIIFVDGLTMHHLSPGQLNTGGGSSSNLQKGFVPFVVHTSANPSYATPFASPDFSTKTPNFRKLTNSPLSEGKAFKG